MWSDENKRSIILAGAGLGGLFLAYKLHVICEKAGRRLIVLKHFITMHVLMGTY